MSTLPIPPESSSVKTSSTRRHRIWELGSHVHCPVLGVCLPIQVLRRLLDKVLGAHDLTSDYEVHCMAISQCVFRTPVAEAIQRELDRRCASSLRQSAKLKTTQGLATWWSEETNGHDLPGALWATITHARCTVDLEQHILSVVHMLQHQLGSANRIEQQRAQALAHENAVLTRELAAVQQRVTRQAAQQAQRIEAQQGNLIRLRAELMGRDTTIAALRQDLEVLEAATPGLKQRFDLTQQTQAQLERIHELQRALLLTEQSRDRYREHALAAQSELAHVRQTADQERLALSHQVAECALSTQVNNQSVLCVGGRRASIPIYREVIEGAGSRFLHHDGGEEDNPSQLDTTLAAADLVICQTGCISHDAYWRVKEHCKRTGKRCVFVETPSRSSLEKALEKIRHDATSSAQVNLAKTAP